MLLGDVLRCAKWRVAVRSERSCAGGEWRVAVRSERSCAGGEWRGCARVGAGVIAVAVVVMLVVMARG